MSAFLDYLFWASIGLCLMFFGNPSKNPYQTGMNYLVAAIAGPWTALILFVNLALAGHAKEWDKKHPPINATAYTDEPCRQSRKEGYQAGKVTAYTEAEMRHSRQRVRWKNDLMAMQGKIAILKNENNKLRNKLYGQQKQNSNG